jgi:surfactin synthase thioesterase subunit
VEPAHAQTRAEPHLARITCAALVINAEQDTGVSLGRAAHPRRLGSTDKTMRSIDTDHYFTTPRAVGDRPIPSPSG